MLDCYVLFFFIAKDNGHHFSPAEGATAELIDDILALDERVAPVLAANHPPLGGIFNVNGTIEKYWITVDTPGRAVVAVEPVETFPSRCYPAMVAETRTVP